jgi:hypothetical protein
MKLVDMHEISLLNREERPAAGFGGTGKSSA